jgi:hypothetical protein
MTQHFIVFLLDLAHSSQLEPKKMHFKQTLAVICDRTNSAFQDYLVCCVMMGLHQIDVSR